MNKKPKEIIKTREPTFKPKEGSSKDLMPRNTDNRPVKIEKVPTCYSCHEVGHKAPECPKKKINNIKPELEDSSSEEESDLEIVKYSGEETEDIYDHQINVINGDL